MDLTMFLAQVMGIYILIAGVSGLLYPKRAKRALEEVTKSYVIPFFDGSLALIVGLLVVLTHNVWEGLAASLVTLIGWAAVVEGVVMLLLPHDSIAAIAEKLSGRNMVMAWSVLAVLVGGFLVYYGFFA